MYEIGARPDPEHRSGSIRPSTTALEMLAAADRQLG
jgi:hypothetical protein